MNGELIAKQYPIGAKVRLVGDSQDEEPRVVEGYKNICGLNYLIFTDGYMAYVERVVV